MSDNDRYQDEHLGGSVPTEAPPATVGRSTVDSGRALLARVASHGFGLGRVEAQRHVDSLDVEHLMELREQLTEDPQLAVALAQQRDVPHGEYAAELVGADGVDGGPAEPDGTQVAVYRAGFDIAFSSYLVEGLLATERARANETEEGADNLESRGAIGPRMA